MRFVRAESGATLMTVDSAEFEVLMVSVCAHAKALEHARADFAAMGKEFPQDTLDFFAKHEAVHVALHDFSAKKEALEAAELDAGW